MSLRTDTPIRCTTWLAPGIDLSVFELAARRIQGPLGRPVELTVVDDCSGPAAGNPLASGEVDFGWMCSTAFVALDGVDLVGVSWAPLDADSGGGPRYFSDLVTNDPGITDVASLDGHRVGCNDEASLSGHYALRWALDDAGHGGPDGPELVFTGGHLASLDALDRGQVDAAVIDSVTRSVHRRDLTPRQRLGPWPTQPLVAGSAVSAGDRELVRLALLATPSESDTEVMHSAGLASFVPVTSADYLPVARRMGIRTS